MQNLGTPTQCNISIISVINCLSVANRCFFACDMIVVVAVFAAMLQCVFRDTMRADSALLSQLQAQLEPPYNILYFPHQETANFWNGDSARTIRCELAGKVRGRTDSN
jgi:hypothetical protein